MAQNISLPSWLDDSQRGFCVSDEKFIRLLAPAGAGKTQSLLYRCKRLLEENPQSRILLFTFTRVARDELKVRLKNSPDFKKCAANITVTTLNSYGWRMVKHKANRLSTCKLIEKKERIWVISNYLQPVICKSKPLEKKMEDKKWRAFNAGKVLDLIDTFKTLGFDHERLRSESDFNAYWNDLNENGLKNMLQTITEDLSRLGIIKNKSKIYADFFKFYIAASDLLRGMNLYTMEDQKYWGWKLSEKGSKLTGAARYSHIMVDEFQDINPVDLFFIKSIRDQHDASLTVVGDDDQAIFEWRGATPCYILDPGKYLTSIRKPVIFETCVLNRNYRSPKNIVQMAQTLIRHNQNRVDKNTQPVLQNNAEIQVRTITVYDDAVQDILAAWNDPNIKNIAVITRKRSQLIPYQIIFAGQNVPFFAAEDLNVFLTEAFNSLKSLIEIKQVCKENRPPSFLYYNTAILELCNKVRKYPLNKADRETVQNHMNQMPLASMEDAVRHLHKLSSLNKIFNVDVCTILEGFLETQTVEEMLTYVGENFAGLQKDLHKADDDIFYFDPPFCELAEFSRRYDEQFDRFYFDIQKAIMTLSSYLQHEEDEVSAEQEKSMEAKLHLMTALRTKGKEYDAVFILAADDKTWPIRFAQTADEKEAERRLFYVAVTRVRKLLCFMRHDNTRPSPYLHELALDDSIL